MFLLPCPYIAGGVEVREHAGEWSYRLTTIVTNREKSARLIRAMDIVLTARVGFILILSQGSQQVRGDFVLGDGQKNYTDAVTACRDNDSQLVLPFSDKHNEQIREYVNKQSLNMAWIDVQIFSTGWNAHHTGMMLYNQGCYNISYLNFTHEYKRSTLMDCHDFCNQNSTKYAAFKQLRPNVGHCICPHHVQVNFAISESKCDIKCWMGPTKSCESYRVVAVNGSKHLPAWDSSQLLPQLSILCGAYYEQDNDGMQFLTRRNCQELLPSLCSTTNGTVIQHTNMTWFEAHTNCTSKGGYLLSHDFDQPQTLDLINNRWYWTGLTAWTWRSNTAEINSVNYTKWAGGHPNLTLGSCVFLNPGGFWESSQCGGRTGYLCERGNGQTSTSTHAPSTTLSTPIATWTASSLRTTRTIADPTSVRGTDPPDVSIMSTLSNDTRVVATTSESHENATTVTITSTFSSMQPNNARQSNLLGVSVGVPLALVAIITGIVLAIVICRRHQSRRPALGLDNPTYDQASDDIIAGKNSVTFDNYEFVDDSYKISQGETSTDQEVNSDHLKVTGAPHDVRTDPYNGLTTEGVLIMDNDLYGDVNNEQNDEPAVDNEIPPVTDEGVFIVENHLYGEQLMNSHSEQANISREDNSGNSRALTSEGVRPPLQNAAVYEDAELVQTEKLQGI